MQRPRSRRAALSGRSGPGDWYRAEGHRVPAGDRFGALLEYWAGADAKPLVLLLDEVDALVGDTLVVLLRQLRADYT